MAFKGAYKAEDVLIMRADLFFELAAGIEAVARLAARTTGASAAPRDGAEALESLGIHRTRVLSLDDLVSWHKKGGRDV